MGEIGVGWSNKPFKQIAGSVTRPMQSHGPRRNRPQFNARVLYRRNSTSEMTTRGCQS